MREFFSHTRGYAVLRSSAQNFLDRGAGQGIRGHTRPDGHPCALRRGRSFQPGNTRKNPRNLWPFLQVSAPANERRQCDSAVAYTGLGPLCRLSNRRFSAWGPPSHTHTAPHGRKAFRFVLDPFRLGKPAPFCFFPGRGLARLPVGKKSCMNGGLRYSGIQPKLFDPGGVWQGNHTPAGAGACRPKRPGCFVLAAASFSPVFALLSAGSRPALTQARRLRACPACLSCAHGCRLCEELRRTPSAGSPAVGKGGPLGPGCLLPAAAKPGGGTIAPVMVYKSAGACGFA